MTEDNTIKFIKNVLLNGNDPRGKEAEKNLRWGLKEYLKKQLSIQGVVKSSDLWVVEFSDNEIKLMTSKELRDYENKCMEFDGFMGCSVLGRLAKSK